MAYDLHHDPRSSHQKIARYVRSLGAGPVLDVGAATGQLGRLFGRDLEVDAIEPDAVSAECARPFYRRVFGASVEAAELPAHHYRVLICADILEHTVDPAAVLRKLAEASTSDARFVISVPNIAHIAARAIILTGHFPQHDRGIFDRSHLHFFTRETLLALVRDAGLRVERLGTTPVPLEAAHGISGWLREPLMRLQVAAARVAPRAFAYQWLLVARHA